tara:strand:+ start:64 stop:570 length:507 start_codon:yes stop_codon:yes gene_type:complete
MPKGLKQSSSVVSIGFRTRESAPNTFTQSQIDLNLSPLDREVFVVLAINLDGSSPDMQDGINSQVAAAVTTTSQTTMTDLDNSNLLARRTEKIRADVGVAVSFSEAALETPPATLDYIGIIATNDFFLGVQGENCLSEKTCTGKLYGYRAVASADIYAALVQSEVLSA